MKNVSTYSDIRQYITETLLLPDNLFLAILLNGLLYSINLSPHITFCLVGNIMLLLINIYIARCILNKNKRLIPDNNNIQKLQNQRDTEILLTDSIEEKIRIDFKYKKEIKKQKRLYISEAYVFFILIFLTNILSILNNIFHLPNILYLLFQIRSYVLYSAIILRIAIPGIKLILVIIYITVAFISICSITIFFILASPLIIISGFILYYIIYLFSVIILRILIITLIIAALISIYSIIIPLTIALPFIIISGYILYYYIVYIFTIKNKYHGKF